MSEEINKKRKRDDNENVFLKIYPLYYLDKLYKRKKYSNSCIFTKNL